MQLFTEIGAFVFHNQAIVLPAAPALTYSVSYIVSLSALQRQVTLGDHYQHKLEPINGQTTIIIGDS